MILAVDIGYHDHHAVAAGVLFRDWADGEAVDELIVAVSAAAEYEPGQFWQRELPCVLALLQQLEHLPAYIIVDGHAYLDSHATPGLGKHLFDALGGKSAIVGVAKSRYKDTPSEAALFRGGSQRLCT